MAIVAVRILPPFAIARLGSADPLESYRIEIDDDHPLDFRTIRPDTTFEVDPTDGSIRREFVPDTITFKSGDGTAIKKVAPFLELWAETDGGALVPVTLDLLRGLGVGPEAISWHVEVGNRKVERRTGDPNDAVVAAVGEIRDHAAHALVGTCPNFVPGGSIAFGSVRYIKPTAEFPQVRFRFTPADGLIYGSNQESTDPQLRKDEQGILGNRRPYDAKRVHDGGWYGWNIPVDRYGVEQPGTGTTFLNETLPPSLFAIVPPAPPWLHGNVAVSRGYFDDSCDGIVDVTLTLASGERLQSSARVTAGPPALVPDALFVRSLADDLEQALLGPEVAADEPDEITRARAEEIVRRAFETARFLNIEVMNGEDVQGRPALDFDTMPAEEAFDTERLMRPVMAAGSVDTLSVTAIHQQVYAALRGGAAPWFVRLLRDPRAVGDFTDDGRRRMPALMCGADGSYLALTYRQIDTIAKVAGTPPATETEGREHAGDPDRFTLTPRNRTAQIHHVAAGNPYSTSPATAIANCCPGLEVDFRAVWRRLFEGITLREYDNLVMYSEPHPGVPDLSGHRLLRIAGELTMTQMLGPSPADLSEGVPVSTDDNPDAVTPLEWSNALARVLATSQGATVRCEFTKVAVWEDPVWWDDDSPPAVIELDLRMRTFFDADTAFISRELARPGELTQGLCSPWQNDFRECSCYYWASARPDFVNVETTSDGRSAGDNWLQKERTGRYVPDDYVDDRLVLYDDLMGNWEHWLRFQVGGRDAPGEHGT